MAIREDSLEERGLDDVCHRDGRITREAAGLGGRLEHAGHQTDLMRETMAMAAA